MTAMRVFESRPSDTEDEELVAQFLSSETRSLKLLGQPEYMVLADPAYHMGLFYVEKLLKTIQNTNPSETSLEQYFYWFSTLLKINKFEPGNHLWQLVKTIQTTSTQFRYSVYIEALRATLQDLRFETNDYFNSVSTPALGSHPLLLWRKLIDTVWAILTSNAFHQKCKRSEKRLARTKLSMEGYLLKLLKKYRRLLVLRVDLAYKAEYTSLISETEARADLARLLANRRHNQKLLPDIVGYVCRIEWTPLVRYHFHVVFLLDGDKHQKGGYFAQVVGQYWVDVITQGKGRFENCNRSKRDYDKQGVGLIHFNNPVEIDNMMKGALNYLVKKEQYLIANALGHRKCIWRGCNPKPK